MKIGRREDGAKEAEVEEVRAIVAGGHHADGDANAGLAGFVGGDEVGGAEQVVVGEIEGVLLRTVHLRGDLHGKVGTVFAGEQEVGNFV